MITEALLRTLVDRLALPPSGLHGIYHWARVLENGRRLAESTGADLDVVELFAVFHDSCRINDGSDHGHGQRGADLAREMRGLYVHLPGPRFELLYTACARHTSGGCEGEITVQTCWDADRLDLGRVGTTPRPELLCTAAARSPEVLSWATERGFARVEPSLVTTEWGLDWSRDGFL